MNTRPSNLINIGEASRILGIAVTTLRTWSNQGYIEALRTPSGQRRYRVEDVQRLMQERDGAA